MENDDIRTKYDKSVNHIIDLQEKVSEDLVDDSIKAEDFKKLKDELSAEKANRDKLFEQLHVADKAKDDENGDDGDDNEDGSDDKCKPKDILDAVDKMCDSLSNKIDDVYNKLDKAIDNIGGKSDKSEVKTEAKAKDEDKKAEPKEDKAEDKAEDNRQVKTTDSIKNLFKELEDSFNE